MSRINLYTSRLLTPYLSTLYLATMGVFLLCVIYPIEASTFTESKTPSPPLTIIWRQSSSPSRQPWNQLRSSATCSQQNKTSRREEYYVKFFAMQRSSFSIDSLISGSPGFQNPAFQWPFLYNGYMLLPRYFPGAPLCLQDQLLPGPRLPAYREGPIDCRVQGLTIPINRSPSLDLQHSKYYVHSYW